MSCNPAIGGLGKGHLTREIDALGGETGKTADMTGLQFRMLNRKRGPSVWAPRAQCDKKAYQFRLKWICERQANLDCKQGQTTKFLVKEGQVFGVETSLDVQYHGKTVVVTTGTFLRGLMHIGQNQQSGGRAGEAAAMGLSGSLKEIGIELGRLKTGTPPRLLKNSLDFSKMDPQPGDEPVPYFTYWKDDLFHMEHSGITPNDVGHSCGKYPPGSIMDRLNGQMSCFITFTTDKTAEIIRVNLHKSPMYSGVIEGSALDIARRLRTRSSSSQRRSDSRFFSNQRASRLTSSMSTDFLLACLTRCRWKWSERSSGAKERRSCVLRMQWNMISPSRRN